MSLCLVVVQSIAIASGVYLGFPVDWFVVNQGTLLGADKALEYGTRFRPTGFFGEPSYMGFIVLMLLFVYIVINRNDKNTLLRDGLLEKQLIVATAFILIFIQSASAILMFILVMVILNYKSIKNYWLLLLAIPFMIYFSSDFIDRIEHVTSGNDESVYIRFVIPWLVIQQALLHGSYFGMNIDDINNYVSLLGGKSIDNALIYLVLHYGLLSFGIIGLLLFYLMKKVSVAFAIVTLLLMSFNGAIFSYDKAFILSFIIISIVMSKKIREDGI